MVIRNIKEFAEYYKNIEFEENAPCGAVYLRLPFVELSTEYRNFINEVSDVTQQKLKFKHFGINYTDSHAQIVFFLTSEHMENVDSVFNAIPDTLGPVLERNKDLISSPGKEFDRVSLLPLFGADKGMLFHNVSLTFLTPFYKAETEINRGFDIYDGDFESLLLVDFDFTIPWTKYDEIEFLVQFVGMDNIFMFYIESYPSRSTFGLLCNRGINEAALQGVVDQMVEMRGKTHNTHIRKNKDVISVNIVELIDGDEFDTLNILDKRDRPAIIHRRINEYISEKKQKAG